MTVLCGRQEEPTAGSRLDRLEPGPSLDRDRVVRAGERRRGTPALGTLREDAKPSLDLQRVRRVGHHEPVALADGTAAREDLRGQASVTFWRVISTSPRGEISTTYVFVRSRSSSLRSASSTVARFLGFAMSMKSMTMIPPMSRSRSWRTTSFTASRLFDRVLEDAHMRSSRESRRSGRC